MTGQYIQRVPNRRRSRGCLFTALLTVVVFAVSAVVLLPYLPDIGLRLAGFRVLNEGDMNRLFAQPSTTLVPPAGGTPPQESPADAGGGDTEIVPPAVEGSSSAAPPAPATQTLSVDIPSVGVIPLEGARQMPVNGVESTVVTLSEAQLNAVCRARVALCGDTPTPPVYGATVDLKSGGAMIYGIINFPQFGIYQPVGVAVRINGADATVLAIDYNGTLYAVPEGGVGDAIADIERRAHDALTQVVGTVGGQSVRFASAHVTEDEVVLVFR